MTRKTLMRISKLDKRGLFLTLGLLAIAGLLFAAAPSRAEAAASLYVNPPSGSFTIGSTFTVSIYVNTGGQAINAVEANLLFPPDKLQVVSPTTGRSLIQVWVSQPTYSNEVGTLKFQGTIPTPGINTDSGLISTVTFRVKSLGTASLKFLDTSRVLLNDGRGTDVLGQTTDGIYYLTLQPPQGPIVTSRTHPDQEKWYKEKTVVFEWTAPLDIQGYSYVLDEDPAGTPDDISEGVKTRVVYTDLADSVYYFHIKSLRQGDWGGVTDYVVRIDTTPPAAFKINISPDSSTSNPRPIIDFVTTDAVSGLDHYDIKIIPFDEPAAIIEGASPAFFVEAISPYSRPLDLGRYNVIVRAHDAAGNYYQAEQRLTILKRFLEFIEEKGLRIAGIYTIGWPYVIILGLLLLVFLAYFARNIWRWHREVERHLEREVHEHPAVAGKWVALKEKLKEYGGGKHLLILLIALAITFGLFAANRTYAQNSFANVTLEPPIVTLFPKSISNDEILYIGGRAGAPGANVLIYLQNVETGSTINAAAATDKDGAWFYSFPQFLTAGNYLSWTQLKKEGAVSPPSSQLNLRVAKTAIQFGGIRFSYQDFYLTLLIIFA
ncbi:MAG: cohesin domain-containing protein, partial [bacterium]|nr:cohesin domain-containing protein [bacterium]